MGYYVSQYSTMHKIQYLPTQFRTPNLLVVYDYASNRDSVKKHNRDDESVLSFCPNTKPAQFLYVIAFVPA